MEFFANFTHNYKTEGTFDTATATNPKGVTITTLAGVVPKLFNAGLSYRSPQGKLFAIVKTNYQSERATQNLPATTAAAQRNPRQLAYQFWDLEVSYKVTQRLKLQLIGRNLTEERPVYSEVGIVRNTQQDTGRQWYLAFKLDL